jgi:hypothetical protein
MSLLIRLLLRPIILLGLGSTLYLSLKKDKQDEVRYYLEYKVHRLTEKLKKWSNPYHR